MELAASAGLFLDEWQQLALEAALGEREDGSWAAFEVGLIVARQNGKGSVLEARELAGLFLFGEQLILHSAHEFKTASEAFRRVLALVQNTPHLEKQVARVRTSHGDEGIELRSGARLRFVARSTGSGRGFSGDCVILDEAYNLSAAAMAALLPTLSARPNPQLWYASSAGMADSEQLRGVRARGMADDPKSLCYLEWSADEGADLDDPDVWAQANPALGIRISEEFVSRERDALGDVEFARERLTIWPDAQAGNVVIPMLVWDALADTSGAFVDLINTRFALDLTPERSFASICAVGKRPDGLPQVEVVAHEPGTEWVVARLVDLNSRHGGTGVVVDPASPAASLIPALERAGVRVTQTTARDMAAACGDMFDAVAQSAVRHVPHPAMSAAIAGARKRQLGDAWAWNRRSTTVDISPLVAATLALWAQTQVQSVVNSVW